MPADLILVVGSTGAGKTTYARQLAGDIGAARFSIDEWMTTLFWPDSPQPIEFDWTIERVRRCEEMIFAKAIALAGLGIRSILDLGFTTRENRDRFREMGAEQGLLAAVHFVDVPAEERWRRVEKRNSERGETYAMQVDRDMFDFMENMWEPPDEAECGLNGGIRVDGGLDS